MMACLVMDMRCGNAKRTDKEFLNVKRGDAEEQIDPEMGWWRRGHIRFMSMRGGGGIEGEQQNMRRRNVGTENTQKGKVVNG